MNLSTTIKMPQQDLVQAPSVPGDTEGSGPIPAQQPAQSTDRLIPGIDSFMQPGTPLYDMWHGIFNGTAAAPAAQSGQAPAGVQGSGVRGQETYTDAWASNPTGAPPVRTWVDPTARTGPNGEYVSAWYDTPAQPDASQAAPATAPPASPLSGLISTLQTTAPAAAAKTPSTEQAEIDNWGVVGSTE